MKEGCDRGQFIVSDSPTVFVPFISLDQLINESLWTKVRLVTRKDLDLGPAALDKLVLLCVCFLSN